MRRAAKAQEVQSMPCYRVHLRTGLVSSRDKTDTQDHLTLNSAFLAGSLVLIPSVCVLTRSPGRRILTTKELEGAQKEKNGDAFFGFSGIRCYHLSL